LVLASLASGAERPPNFVIIFADDLGYGDLGCFGHPTIVTPRLDRMASEGMKLTQFYAAAPVCTPSRAALITGRLPPRTGMCGEKSRVLFPNSAGGLPDSEVTIAEALKASGYATACIGKWHLGHLPQYLPNQHGFDFAFGLPYSNDMDRVGTAPRGRAAFLHPQSKFWNVPLLKNGAVIEQPADQTQLTKRYTQEAIKFIDAHQQQPFFLYLPHSMPHVPLFASEDFAGQSRRGLYGDVVEELDWSVGQILDKLRELKLEQNTLVLFTSDNGPWLIQHEQGGSAGLLRDGKGSTWDGGMREPTVAWWPGKIAPGTTSPELTSTLDLFPTLHALAGIPLPQDVVLDGYDISPVLLKNQPSPRETFPYYREYTLMAFRQGPWKLHLLTQDGYGQPQPTRHERPLLFNLDEDPSEVRDVAAEHPEVVAKILQAIEAHQGGMTFAKSQLEERLK
jgi:arylsulfatase A-like enzyme